MSTRSLETLSYDGARTVLDACIGRAAELGLALVVAVTDVAGVPIATARMDGAPLLSVDVAKAKAWTVTAFGQPTDWWADLLAESPGLAALGKGNMLMPVPGGVPVSVDGEIVGAVGVSGGSAEEDAAVAAHGAAALS